MYMHNLWPKDISLSEVKAPVAILRQQASALGSITQNVVEAKVAMAEQKTLRSGYEPFTYRFYLVAPALQGYRYKLFTMWHDVNLYPVKFSVDSDIRKEWTGEENVTATSTEEMDDSSEQTNIFDIDIANMLNKKPSVDALAESEEEFMKILANIFRAKKTRQVIQAMLAQSENYIAMP
jgi:hypothetical protein